MAAVQLLLLSMRLLLPVARFAVAVLLTVLLRERAHLKQECCQRCRASCLVVRSAGHAWSWIRLPWRHDASSAAFERGLHYSRLGPQYLHPFLATGPVLDYDEPAGVWCCCRLTESLCMGMA